MNQEFSALTLPRPLLRILTLGLLMACPGVAARAQGELSTLPAVRQWRAGEGLLRMERAVLVPPAGSQLPDQAAMLAAVVEDWRALLGNSLLVLGDPQTENGTPIRLHLERPQRATAQDYRVHVGTESVAIHSSSLTGLFYGTRVVLQLLHASGAQQALPLGTIHDAPTSRRRMLMLDTGRKFFPIPVLEDYLRAMAWLRMNELHLHLSDQAFGGAYTGFRVQCDTFPGLTSKDGFYSKQELRALQDFARVRGIVITPEIDMPGHARVFTDYWPDLLMEGQKASYMDVTNPKTVERMQALLDEMIPIFDAPDFHIGTDEYRVSGSEQERLRLHEGFRVFINTMNAHVRSHGKVTRIWSGFEHMLGATVIDSTVCIDMWETDDARAQIALGHSVINSNHGRTYIVPGAAYYGVSNPGVYATWDPFRVSSNAANNPDPSSSKLLGGKLHVWNDQGPTGYTHTEIADLALPSLTVFAEKMWGTKGSPDYAAFKERAAKVGHAPGLEILKRLPADENGLVFELTEEKTLHSADDRLPLPWADKTRQDLEYPWTLVVEIKKTAASSPGGGVLLSSNLAEISDAYVRTETITRTDAETGKKTKHKVELRDLGIVRAAGSPGAYPAESRVSADLSRVYTDSLPLDKWVTLAIVAQRRHTEVFIDGVSVGQHGKQTLCPLAFMGGSPGRSFVGSLRNLQLWNHALRSREVARRSGLELPANYAFGAGVSASHWHEGHPLQASNLCDEQPGTRWSSGPSRSAEWIQLDLGQVLEFGRVHLVWEAAFAQRFQIQVGEQAHGPWTTVLEGIGHKGPQTASFDQILTRHLRINMQDPATQWGYSLFEIQVWP